jgi:hypothetical protein
MLRGFTISQFRTPHLPTPGLSNTQVLKYQNVKKMVHDKVLPAFMIRETMMQVLPLFSVLRISRPQNAKIYLTTASFQDFRIHDFAIPTTDGSWSFNLLDPEMINVELQNGCFLQDHNPAPRTRHMFHDFRVFNPKCLDPLLSKFPKCRILKCRNVEPRSKGESTAVDIFGFCKPEVHDTVTPNLLSRQSLNS